MGHLQHTWATLAGREFGELVAGGGRGVDFYAVAPSMAAHRRRAPLAYVVFDVPHLAGEPTIGLTYRDRRRLLELLELDGPVRARKAVGGLADAERR